MSVYDDPDRRQRGKMHAGFRIGLIMASVMIAIHLCLLLIFGGETNGDWIAWGIQLLLYFFGAQAAAQQHYSNQERTAEPLRGVLAAGLGAAITTSLLVWFYIILRGIFRDAFGIIILIEPISLFIMIVADVLLAIGIGTWGGAIVEKKYKSFTDYGA